MRHTFLIISLFSVFCSACTDISKQVNDTVDYQSSVEEREQKIDTVEVPNEPKTKPFYNWKNPVLMPTAASLGNTLRAYFLVGQFDQMLSFIHIPQCMSRAEAIMKLRNFNWGYDIDMTNVQWNPDSSFVMTYQTFINNTVGIDQYFGRVVDDTARLVMFADSEHLFKYRGELFDEAAYCSLMASLSNIKFEFDSSVMLKESQPALLDLLNFFSNNPGIRVKLIGHTSTEGGYEYNMKLSKDRATAIASYLIQNGVSKDQVIAEGKGSTQPIYTSYDSEELQAKNRRVEIVILNE